MSNQKTGEMAWLDLTVEHAVQVKDFYQSVIGWKADAVSMGEYDDFAMVAPISGETVSGICHARGANGGLPAMWLPYFLVDNLDESISQVEKQGGHLITAIKSMGDDRYIMIKDPAGAACALYQKAIS
jgi:predicted enzyme related to lactoylglutathione lyase